MSERHVQCLLVAVVPNGTIPNEKCVIQKSLVKVVYVRARPGNGTQWNSGYPSL